MTKDNGSRRIHKRTGYKTQLVLLPSFPELRDQLARYSVGLDTNPPYVVVGCVRSPALRTRMIGVIAAAGNELHGHLLRRLLGRYGLARVERTHHHPDGATFDLPAFVTKVEEHGRRS